MPTPASAPLTYATSAPALAPYAGDFGRAEAWHLLRRATFAATAEQVDRAVAAGLAATLEHLAGADEDFAPPINYDFPDDPYVPIGETWVDAPYLPGVDVSSYRIASYYRWLVDNFLSAGTSLERRLMLFLLNHFGAAGEGDVRVVYDWYELLRAGTRMSFEELVRAVTIHPLMLNFLDGRTNSASSPNENYARELLELFTVGKGPLVGPGDYTNYTEDDIRAIARALTGWRVRGEYGADPDTRPESYFRVDRHDTGDKQLSERLGGFRLGDSGAAEYGAVVDAVFTYGDVASHICRKLYRWFCFYDVTDEVEQTVIPAMAEAFVTADYQLSAPVTLLLGSAHFYEQRFRGALVKSPLDEACDLTVGLGIERPATLDDQAWLLGTIGYICGREGMGLVTPPSVAGFKAFHQDPLYNRFWINAATLQSRHDHAAWGFFSGYTRDGGPPVARVDLLAYIARLENPSDPNALVAEVAEHLLPVSLLPSQLEALKAALIPGLPDFEWTVEYGKHLDDPEDDMLRDAVRWRLTNLFYTIANAAEFHLY